MSTEPEIICEVQTHRVQSQLVTVHRDGDGHRLEFGQWEEECEIPFSAPEGILYEPETGEWHTVGTLASEHDLPVDVADGVQIGQDDAAELALARRALAGLRAIHAYIEPDDPDGGPSGADTCDALYSLLTRLGMEVP